MAEAVTIQVEPRDAARNKGTGSRVARRLRRRGMVPAIVYGHKQHNQPIAVSREQVWALIKKGSHLAQLQADGLNEMVLIRDVQWDHLGKEIIHLDFVRVSAHERVTTEVPILLHGTPAGLSEGGSLEQPIHSLEISAEVTSIPDHIRVDVDHLRLHDMIHVRELKLPAGVEAVTDADQVVVHVALKKAAAEPTPGAEAPASAEPEVIGRKKEKEDEEPAKK
jgi:large subunit ribosomal protein L25